MDPITLIVTALAAGAAAALKDTASAAVKDAYAGLKAVILQKYGAAAERVAHLEVAPDSPSVREGLTRDLGTTEAGRDPAVLQQAAAVLTAVQTHDPDVGRTIGVDLADVRAAALRLSDISASGDTTTVVRVRQGTFSGDIEIKGVHATDSTSPKT